MHASETLALDYEGSDVENAGDVLIDGRWVEGRRDDGVLGPDSTIVVDSGEVDRDGGVEYPCDCHLLVGGRWRSPIMRRHFPRIESGSKFCTFIGE